MLLLFGAEQYKNFKNVFNLVYHKADFGIKAQWYCFPIAHGKGRCDGLGGSLKRAATLASLRMTGT